jgi:hypothetical protein
MYSEGADNTASKGLLDPCGGFYIVDSNTPQTVSMYFANL